MNRRQYFHYALIFIVLAVFIGAFFILPDKNEIKHEQLNKDITINTIIDSYNLKGNDLIIRFHHTSSKPEPVKVIGAISYKLSDSMLEPNEMGELIVYDWNEEYFNLKIGSMSDVFSFGKGDWVIEQNKVRNKDVSRAYISVEPYTIKGSGNIIINLTSREYGGNIDMAVCAGTNSLKPQSISLKKKNQANISKSYACNPPYTYGYATNPKHFKCYYPNGSILFEHDFETADLNLNTTYWTETKVNDWKKFTSKFSSVDVDFKGMNKCYVARSLPVKIGRAHV